MLKKHTEEITENDEVFVVETYTNDEGVVKGKTKYLKPSEVAPEPVESTPDPVMEKLDSIEAKIQTNEDLQTFYDEIVKEVGL